MNRRDLLKTLLVIAAWFKGLGRGVRAAERSPAAPTPAPSGQPAPSRPVADADYIVVGSGAGGGTVAARLAERGFRVLLLEAGGDPRKLHGGDAQDRSGRSEEHTS